LTSDATDTILGLQARGN